MDDATSVGSDKPTSSRVIYSSNNKTITTTDMYFIEVHDKIAAVRNHWCGCQRLLCRESRKCCKFLLLRLEYFRIYLFALFAHCNELCLSNFCLPDPLNFMFSVHTVQTQNDVCQDQIDIHLGVVQLAPGLT